MIRSEYGITLIEIIITIIIMAIAAVMIMVIFGKQFTGSAIPVAQVQSQYKLVEQMEKITSQYRDQITNNQSFNLASFKSSFIDGKPYVDSANTGMVTFTYGARTTQQCLKVTLKDGDQTLVSIFTY
jgi:type II secretory pathway component PulJ